MPADERHDVVVVGAGIHGAGIAQAAAAAGYGVLILERTAIAAGTSSRSSKLIHGGLRYLETGQLRLVYECLRERRRLLQLAPDLVRMVPCSIPVYRHARRGPGRIRLGLSLYALLGGLARMARFRRLGPPHWGRLDGLRRDGLRAVYRYWDARTDDAALTRAVVASALDLGARLAVPAELDGAAREGDEWRISYRDGNDVRVCRARVLVNAAGPWVDAVLSCIDPPPRRMPFELVQGTHVLVEGRLEGGIYYVEAPADGRAVFIMPWRGQVLVGTTETAYRGDPGAVKPLDGEVGYLLATLEHYFPAYRGARPTHAFAGLRVLPCGEGAWSGRPRDTLLYDHDDAGARLLTVYGGKLTAYRLTAERALRRIARWLPRRAVRADTRTLSLATRRGIR